MTTTNKIVLISASALLLVGGAIYYRKKIRGKCEICNEKMGEEIHHMQQQKDSNEQGFIGSFHKNHPANLMSICTVCHDKIHNDKQSDETMLVRRKTTNGYMLKEVERENIMKVPWGSI